ncbi:hypothetical protein BDP27DRAFT_1361615 [Rhodocollybia butyracea]|uniref:Uncharacterized protein n=1 Tax=Rhodocollybia butyracea TaxID=206335 RepID=A0A9P5PYP3_9AGAR|nr:hypothetical protein BDP27DRAFT_1361615 [Rhodocollybia butyracea]
MSGLGDVDEGCKMGAEPVFSLGYGSILCSGAREVATANRNFKKKGQSGISRRRWSLSYYAGASMMSIFHRGVGGGYPFFLLSRPLSRTSFHDSSLAHLNIMVIRASLLGTLYPRPRVDLLAVWFGFCITTFLSTGNSHELELLGIKRDYILDTMPNAYLSYRTPSCSGNPAICIISQPLSFVTLLQEEYRRLSDSSPKKILMQGSCQVIYNVLSRWKEVLLRSSPLLPAMKLVLTGADVEQDEDVEMEPVFLFSGNRKWKRPYPDAATRKRKQ